MAERAFMYCPTCRMSGVPHNEVFRIDNTKLQCTIGHVFSYDTLMAAKPEMIRKEVLEQAGPGDVTQKVFINGEVLRQFNEKYPGRLSATVTQILRNHLDDDMVIVDGMQARELHSLKVKTGAEIVAAVKQNMTLVDENEDLRKKLSFIEGMFTRNGVAMPEF